MNNHLKSISRKRHGTGGLLALLVVLFTVGTLRAAEVAGQYEFKERSLLTQFESCPNGVIDPGETNTVRVRLKKLSSGTHEEVRVEFKPEVGNVAFTVDIFSAGSIAKDNEFNSDVRFRSAGECGQTLTPTIRVSWKSGSSRDFQDITINAAADNGDKTKSFRMGANVAGTYTFQNTAPITINDFDPASDKRGRSSPYGLGITPSGVPNQADPSTRPATGERLKKAIVTLNNITHPFAQDLNVVLVSPWGERIALMKQAGGINPLSGATLTFDSGASQGLPASSQINSGTFKPADYNAAETLPDVAGAYSTDLGSLDITTGETADKNPNQQWRLFVQDDTIGGSGQIAGGWTLQLITDRVECCGVGTTFPTISQVRDGLRRPGIGNREVNEDVENTVINFSVNDLETNDGNLNNLTVTSSDQALVADSQLVLEKITGTENRKLTVKKLGTNLSGTTVLTVTITDASGLASSTTFNFKINAQNDLPVVSTILGQAANVGQSTIEVPFNVSDIESDASTLVLTVESTDPAVVPVGNVFIRGSGGSRTVQVTPAASGVSTITIRATDPQGGSGTSVFKVAFETSAGDPTMTPVLNQEVDEDKSLSIPVIVRSNSTTPVTSISVSAISSDNSAVIPVSGVSITGTGTERSIVITPLANQNGIVNLRLKVLDPGNSKSSTNEFQVNVRAVNDAPAISQIGDQTINEDANTGQIVVNVSDVDDTAAVLAPRFTVESLNTDLIPNEIIGDATTTPGIERTISTTDGTGSIRIKPRANKFGRGAIRVSVEDDSEGTEGRDKKGTASRIFNVTVSPVNDAPVATTVTVVPGTGDNQVATENIGTGTGALADNATDVTPTLSVNEDPKLDNDGNPKTIAIRVSGISPGPEEAIDQTGTVGVQVSVNNADQITSLSTTKSTLNNTESEVEIRFRVAKNYDGDATFTLTLTDNSGASIQRKFKLDVLPVNDSPSLSAISDRTVSKLSSGITIPISVSDVETRTPLLSMTAVVHADDVTAGKGNFISTAVFDAANTTLSIVKGAGIVTTTGDQTVRIVVTATDRGATDNGTAPGSTPRTFTLTFSNNRPPSFDPVERTINIVEDGVASTTFTVEDDRDLSEITFTARSSNTALVNAGNNVLFNRSGATLTVIIIPTADVAGSADVTIVASDVHQLDATATVKLTVTQVDDTPTIQVQKPGGDGSKWSGTTLSSNEGANPVQDPKTASKLIEVRVNDPETSADALKVTATSDDTDVIPNANIVVSATGSTRTLTITPAADRFKLTPVNITVRVEDNVGKSATETFGIDVAPRNDAPTVDPISNVTVAEDSGPRVINLTGITPGPFETQDVTLSLAARDAGTDSFVAASGIVDLPAGGIVSGTANITITPKANKSGTTTIRFRFDDGGADGSGNVKRTERTITFAVTPINDAPGIRFDTDSEGSEESSELSVASGSASSVKPIFISDVEADSATKLSELSVTAVSSNPTLIPNTPTNLELGGAGANRGLIVRPATGQFGVADVTITVTDKGQPTGTDVKTASKVLTVRVDAGQNPIVSKIADITIQKNEDTPLIEFTVNDAQTAAGSLSVTATADNKTLVPDGNFQFATSGGTRLMIIRPASNQSGIANITVTVRDAENNAASTTFKLTVQGEAPTISSIATPQTVQRNGTLGPIAFTVSDRETFAGFLRIAATSSNPAFIPEGIANITIGGSGNNRTITVKPAADRTGSSTITVTVTDLDGQTATSTFVVSTPDTNTAPTISSIANQATGLGQTTGTISVTIGDGAETPVDQLSVTAASSNKTVVPDTGIFISAAGATRNILITPAAGQSGSSTITVTVTDKGDPAKSASTSFTLTVSDNQAPTISAIGAQTTQKNTATSAISFTVGDTETAAGSLTVAGTSGNTTVVPNASIVVSGTGASRTVVVTPANNQTGSATITLTVTDGGNKTASTSFTLTVSPGAPAKGDLDGDGKSDIIYQDNEGFLAAWYMDGRTLKSASFLIPSNIGDPNWRIVATGDLNRNGQEDILFQHTDGTLAAWYMNGSTQVSVELLNPSNPGDPNWKVAAVADLNTDGNADLLFQHTNGNLAAWYMNGINLVSATLLSPSNPGDANWRVVDTGDFNADGKQDIAFQHKDGTLAAWYMNGASLTQATLLTPSSTGDPNWRLVGVTDRNNDKKVDLLFQHADSTLAVWFLNGVNLISAELLNPSSSGGTWRVVAP